jgi:hypothetical protein
MRKLSPAPYLPRSLSRSLSNPRWLRGIDALIDHVNRVWDEHQKHRPRRMDRKALPKSA